jgi:hypothetical protein
MALKKTIKFKGIEIKNAYIRVWKFEGSKSEIFIGVGFYKDSESEIFDSKTFNITSYNLDGSNPIAQAYEHLKTLPEFAGAEDC